MSIRPLHRTLRNSLLNEEPFLYAHLVKFERVVTTVSGKPAESPSDYSYMTDASFDISFDDLSRNLKGEANGAQPYVANRLKKVGTINETTEAKASNMTITISSVALNSTIAGAQLDITSSGDNKTVTVKLDTGDDWVESGFSEGDKITFTHGSNASDANHNNSVTIKTFTDNNMTAICTNPNYVFSTISNTTSYTVTLSTDEVVALLNDPTDTTYNGYINREVYIYKAHITPETGAIIGEPFLIFKGIITKGSLGEDPSKDSTMKWTMSSHWGDFVRVNGRITADSEHRAIGSSGEVDGNALHRYEYGNDYGFEHSEQAINMMATYQVQETRYKMKKSGLFGLKRKLKEYQVTVDKDVDLKLNLEARHLPVVYGVSRIDSIPVFADMHASKPNLIYAMYALCEGEISGLYDLYIDDESRICVDKKDLDAREDGTDAEVICTGRMDRGDTMSSAAFLQKVHQREHQNGTGERVAGGTEFFSNEMSALYYRMSDAPDESAQSTISGVTHETKTSFISPIATKLYFHAGRPHQRADDMILGIAEAGATSHRAGAAAEGFKIQDTVAEPENYWTGNHRMLDTAYVAAEFTVADGDITIPAIDFVVRGREIEQHNYDYSYRSHTKPAYTGGVTSATQIAKFSLGDIVDFYSYNGGGSPSAMATYAQITDKYEYVDGKNETHTKFRFSKDPNTKTDKSIGTHTDFFMVKTGVSSTSNDRFHMTTWDNRVLSNTLTSTLEQAVHTDTSDNSKALIAPTSVSGGLGVDITNLSALIQNILAYDLAQNNNAIGVALVGDNVDVTDATGFSKLVHVQPLIDTTSGVTTIKNIGNTTVAQGEVGKIVLLNVIQLVDVVNNRPNGYYNGHTITITHEELDGTVKTQQREIVDYIGGTVKIAFVGSAVAAAGVTDTLLYASGTTHHRVSIGSNDTTTITFDSVANLAAGDFLTDMELVQKLSPNIIPDNTKILSITGNVVTFNNKTTVRKFGFMVFTRRGASGRIFTPTPFDFEPTAGDTFEISPIGDRKVSINPAIQLLDYLRNERFGRGLDLYKDINLESFKQAARLCDTRSNVTVSVNNSASVQIGQEFSLIPGVDGTPYFQWQGKVKTIESVTHAGTTYKQLTFSDCIGKLCYQWNDWRVFSTGEHFYYKTGAGTVASPTINKLYAHTGSPSTLTASAVESLTPLSSLVIADTTNASVTASIFIGGTTLQSSADDNPVVKKFRTAGGRTSFSTNGYDLYDSDDVKYWRYMGWQSHDQREVTRHQTNAVLRTEGPVFNNVNSLLEHFNGVLRFSNGKYELDVESTSPQIGQIVTDVTITNPGSGFSSVPNAAFSDPGEGGLVALGIPSINAGSVTGFSSLLNGFGYFGVPTVNIFGGGGSNGTATVVTKPDPRIITENDIIGAIKVDDAGVKKSANTVSVSIPDPQIKFDNRSVAFFKSDYLKEDRGIPKKKDIKTPLISNYFNARLNAEQYLDQSRFSRKINFTMGPKGVLLVAGTIIEVTYPRFGWANKMFRISNLGFKEDCLVQVTAQEHSDDTYFVQGSNKRLHADEDTRPPPVLIPQPSPPSALTASTNLQSKIKLAWINSAHAGNSSATQVGTQGYSVEVWGHTNSSFTNGTGAILLTTTKESTYEHNLPELTATTNYFYWIRHIKEAVVGKHRKKTVVASLFHPANGGAGVEGQASALQGQNAGIVYVYKLVAQGTAAPTIQSTFPSITVTLDGGANHNKITAIPSGNGSASLSGSVGSFSVIGTNGVATGWSTNKPSITGTNNIWMSAATTNSSSGSDDIARTEWAGPIQDSGTHGESSATVTIYRATGSASSPALPNGNSSFTFNTGALSTSNLNGWTVAQPATDQSSARYLWKSTAAALAVTSVSGSTIDNILSAEWSSPVNIHINPIDGAATVLIYLYKSSVSVPASPTSSFPTATITLSGSGGGTITSPNTVLVGEGWYKTPQTPGTGEKLWIVAATANSTGTSDTIAYNEWSSPPIQFTGSDGSDGFSSHTVEIFKASASAGGASTKPVGNTTYTFSNGATSFANANGWSITQPSLSGSTPYMYRRTGAAIGRGVSDIIPDTEWSGAALVGQPGTGTPGTSGIRGSSFIIYHTNPSAGTPGNPSASLYTFGAAAPFTSLSSGWSTTAPNATAGTSSSNYWYATVNVQEGKNAAGVATGTAAGASYSTANGQLLFSVAYIGLAFTGLVTFNALSTDGSTTIHGGNISTGTILANRIVLSGINTGDLNDDGTFTDDTKATEAFNLAGGKNKTFYQSTAPTSGMIVGDLWVDDNAPDLSSKYYRRSASAWVSINPTSVGGWNLNVNRIYSGTEVTNINTGYASSAGSLGHITLNSAGSIHTPFFYSNPGGAGFRGTLTVDRAGTPTTIDLGASGAFDTYVGQRAPIQSITLPNGSTLTGAATLSASALQLSSANISDVQPTAGMLSIDTSLTDISAGKIILTSGHMFFTTTTSTSGSTSYRPNNSIVLDTTSGNNSIEIRDGSVVRVKIGKL